jgi:hypothetical protein
MLSPKIKQKIEKEYGEKIRYPKQCENLAIAISNKVKCKISSTTVKRMFGFVPGTEAARLWTLDIVAAYVNYSDWDALITDIVKAKIKKVHCIESVQCKNVKAGTRIRVSFGALPFFEVECVGRNNFKVLDQIKTGLLAGDIIEVVDVELNAPLLVRRIKRESTTLSGMVLGKITGVTSISIINKS